MNIFKRLFKIGSAEAHSAVDKLENPIKMTEEGIRDLKSDLEKSLESLAQVKAMAIKSRNEMDEAKESADSYQKKAMLLLKKAKVGDISIDEADRLAKKALILKDEKISVFNKRKMDTDKFDKSVVSLENNVNQIKSNIQKWESELKTLKARVKVSKATKNLNKQLAEIDNSSTLSMLEKMKSRVTEEEAIAEAYGDIANANKNVDKEIDHALDNTEIKAEDDLAKLKEQLGMNDSSTSEG